MTEPTISDYDLNEFCVIAGITVTEDARQALAAFLANRVPDALRIDADTPPGPASRYAAFNECREAVLAGTQHKEGNDA